MVSDRQMSLEPGTYTLGPENARLLLRTARRGGAAKAGHDLLIEVTSWRATIEAGDEPSSTELSLSADSTSLRVLEGTGGIKALDDDDKDNIRQTIDEDVLKGTAIDFRSTAAQAVDDSGRLEVQGELELFGKAAPVSFALQSGQGGHLTAAAIVRQSDWGIKPYSALFGALKVADEVQVEFDGHLPSG
jgi:polyisoprenoid-binding protein YceI